MKLLLLSLSLFSLSSWATDYGYLKPEDQKYYKNESFAGNNQLERIDSLVKEVNKLYGEVSALKASQAQMQREIDELKAKK